MPLPRLPRRSAFFLLGAALAGLASLRAADDWQPLFDGKTLAGWKASENPASVRVDAGTIFCDGPRAHLFYVGPDGRAEFENFELELEILAAPGANSGVYFNTAWQDSGWPRAGFEAQVNNTQPVFETNYIENKKTGSLYGIRNLYKPLVRDGEWFTMRVTVRRPRIEIRLNGALVTAYTEPANSALPSPGPQLNLIGRGTIALQCHDEASKVRYRNIRLRRLPPGDDPAVVRPTWNEQDLQRLVIGKDNFPLVDLHTRLGAGLDRETVFELSRAHGLGAGLVADSAGLRDDAAAEAFTAPLAPTRALAGLLATERDWHHRLSPAAQARFDYVIARVAPAGTADEYADAVVRAIESEPVDIVSGATAFPGGAAPTEAQLQRIIAAAVKHGVAFEIGTRDADVSAEFVRQARAAGARFTIGSRSATAATWTDWPHFLRVQKEAGLTWRNIYMPRHYPSRAQRAAAGK